MDFKTEITALKGIGNKNALLFKKLNIQTLGELIQHFPKDFESFEEPLKVDSLPVNRRASFVGKICKEPSVLYRKGKSILTFYASDETGTVKITYFNMPYLKKTLSVGSLHVFYGTIRSNNSTLYLEQPRMIQPAVYKELLKDLQPIYVKTKGLSNDTLKKYIKMALENIEETEEFLPDEIIDTQKFLPYMETIKLIHMPPNRESIYKAKRRLAYEEFFFFMLSLKYLKEEFSVQSNAKQMIPTAQINLLIESLPYRLTDSQKRAYEEIEADMCEGRILNRLLQGDVGSGKTIVAVLALLLTVTNGCQGAFMVPTEVLALQHFETIKQMCQDYKLPFRPVLLVGSLTAKNKREAKQLIADGTYNLVIGTHALLEDNVVFLNLGLVITDEQHRFGVAQREKLTKKSENVHTLVMSATPIPRSLAIILYGELDISTIPELPANRLPIKNCVVGTNFRNKTYQFIEKQVKEGRQAYIICPMVESGIMDELENVVEYADKLKKELNPQIQIAYLHGKMPAAKKNHIMEEFSAGIIQVLVSTTVIEVGINVPNATVMVVENADRFGLSTLHQLRGRVGRGAHQSYCVFIDTKENSRSKERLAILNQSNDGFYIANEDLRLRGPGDLLGIMQSGEFAFKIADIYSDADMLKAASADVNKLLAKDPSLADKKYKSLKKRLIEQIDRQYGKTI